MATYEQLMAAARAAKEQGQPDDKIRRLLTLANEFRKPTEGGSRLVEMYGNGGRIYEDEQGNQSYVADGYTTSDPDRIAQIREREGSQLPIKAAIAKDVVGEGQTRAMSTLKGVPFGRGYVEKLGAFGEMMGQALAGQFADKPAPAMSEETLKLAVKGREMEAPAAVAASRLATGIAATAPVAPLFSGGVPMQILKGGAYGAPMGALEGAVAGYGEGGIEEAKRQAQVGAAVGTVAGTVAPPVSMLAGMGFQKVAEGPVRDIVGKITQKKDAAKVLQEFLAMDSAQAVESAKVAGPYGSISVLGPNTEALLDTVANSTGTGARVAKENLNDTANAAANDLTATIDDILGKPTVGPVTQKAGIMADTATQRKELYGAAYETPIDYASAAGQKIKELFDSSVAADRKAATEIMRESGYDVSLLTPRVVSREEAAQILSKTKEQSQIFVRSLDDGTVEISMNPNMEMLDNLSQALWSRGSSLIRQGDDAAGYSKRALAMRIKSAMDDVSPDYRNARLSGKDAIDQRTAVDVGQSLLNPKTTREVARMEIDGMNDVSLRQLRQALRNQIDEVMANAKYNPRSRNDANLVENLAMLKYLGSRAAREKLSMELQPEEAARLAEQITQSQGALLQQAMVNANSKTHIRRMVDEKLNSMLSTSAAEAVEKGGLLGAPVTAALRAADVGGLPKMAQKEAISGDVAQVLTKRMTPEDLLRQAQQIEQMSPLIRRAEETGQTTRQLLQSLGMGGLAPQFTQSQSQQPDSQTMQLLRSLGLMR